MRWFFGFIASYFFNLLTFLVKKFGYQAVLFVALKTAQILIIALLLTFFVYFTTFFLQVWSLITNFINHLQSLSIANSSTYGGVTLDVILANAKGFIYASGLSDALVTSGNLFISFLSLIFIKSLYKIYVFVYLKIYNLFTDGINVLAGSSTISL